MKSVFVGDYYLTGDRAYMDEDGYIWFVGRADDVILSSGLVFFLPETLAFSGIK